MIETSEFLNIREVGERLQVAEKSAYPMALRGEWPTLKVRGQWRRRHADLHATINALRGAAPTRK
jgi:hypothetical protein